MSEKHTAQQVYAALDQAAENGYDMRDHPPQVVVCDLMDCHSDFCSADEVDLLAHIIAWQAERKKR